MSEDPRRWISYSALTELAAVDALERDRDGGFPERAFAGLRQLGLISNPPLQSGEIASLVRVLSAIGRGNLSVGRVYEGHVNALLLVQTFGTAQQQRNCAAAAKTGELLGVWNTDLPNDPMRLEDDILKGSKNFASGADGLSAAIVTAAGPEGRQMALVPVRDLPTDRSWWKPLGMRASGSHIVTFETRIDATDLLGGPNDYQSEPAFSAGFIRCAAVHVGGMQAVFDAYLAHLKKIGRADNAHQQQRLGSMATEVASGYAWLDYAAKGWTRSDKCPATALVACVNAARGAIERAALNVMELGERCVGVAGMMEGHPLERLSRDLRTYLRQPNPDGALASIGAAVASGVWQPDAQDAYGARHGD
jgi:alkylation response protein AidB-like acyl-CoA dehydrogenase